VVRLCVTVGLAPLSVRGPSGSCPSLERQVHTRTSPSKVGTGGVFCWAAVTSGRSRPQQLSVPRWCSVNTFRCRHDVSNLHPVRPRRGITGPRKGTRIGQAHKRLSPGRYFRCSPYPTINDQRSIVQREEEIQVGAGTLNAITRYRPHFGGPLAFPDTGSRAQLTAGRPLLTCPWCDMTLGAAALRLTHAPPRPGPWVVSITALSWVHHGQAQRLGGRTPVACFPVGGNVVVRRARLATFPAGSGTPSYWTRNFVGRVPGRIHR